MLIPGRNPTIEALKSQYRTVKILLQQDINQDKKIEEIFHLAKQKGIKIEEISRKKLDKLAQNDPHQGVIIDVSFEPQKLTTELLEDNPGLYLYVREAQYEHNLGAIIRTAEVAGVKGIILPPKQEITPTVARISMGALFHLPIFQHSLFPAMKLFQKSAYSVWGLERGGKNIYEIDLPENLLILVGGEDRGISQEVAGKCDGLLTIPQFGKVNSLNMSVAAGVAIYEYVRQNS